MPSQHELETRKSHPVSQSLNDYTMTISPAIIFRSSWVPTFPIS
jgi:hypothetical protein